MTQDPSNEPEEKADDPAVDGLLREYARTGSAGDDEGLVSRIRTAIEAGTGGASEALLEKANPWLLGAPFWKLAAVLIALATTALLIQTSALMRAQPDPTEILVQGQPRLIPGAPLSMTAFVRDTGEPREVKEGGADASRPVAEAEVEVFLVSTDGLRRNLGTFRSDEDGLVQIEAEIADDLPEGDYDLQILAKGSTGKAEARRSVTLQRSFRTLLSTDKPIYQPGQTIHLRALSLATDDLKPVAGREVRFEISDPKGNRVFAKNLKTSDFGIASADFVLADQVNEGAYTIASTVGDTTSEKTVQVERYVLPKYRIDLAADKPWYAPGDTVDLTLDANYTFGEVVPNAEVEITASSFVETFRSFHKQTATTDEDGHLRASIFLKDSFVGQALNQGDASVQILATVTDSAGHRLQKTLNVKVTNRPLRVEVFPESGELVQGVENIVYVLTAYPDGSPAPSTIEIGKDSKVVETTELGLAKIKITPREENLQTTLRVTDRRGNKVTEKKVLRTGKQTGGLLLRTDRAVYRHGETAALTILSASPSRRVFVDVVQGGRSLLTQSVALADGKGELALDLDPTLLGTLQLQAYSIELDGEITRDTRLIQVNQSDSLVIEASLDKESYRPAEQAVVEFLVTKKDGTPVEAALSLAAVDEAVFALHSARPGLEEMYFLIQEEILKPRYQLTAEPRFTQTDPDPLVPDPQFAEAEVALFSVGEGAAAEVGPEQDKSEPIAQRTSKLAERKEQQKTNLTLAGITLPWALFLIGSVLAAIYTSMRLRRSAEVIGIGSASLGEREVLLSHLRKLRWWLVAACVLPILFPILVRMSGARPDAASLFSIPFVLAGFGILLFSGLQFQKNPASRLFPTMRRLALVPAILYTLAAATIALLILAADALPWKYEWLIPTILFSLMGGLALLFGAIGVWRRSLFAKQGVGRGLLTWLAPVGIAALALFGLVFTMHSGLGSAKFAATDGVMMEASAETADGGSARRFFEAPGALLGLAEPETTAITADDSPIDMKKGKGGAAPVRVRRHFPETLLWQPQLITDTDGKAQLEIPLADSITTWRLSGSAVSKNGSLGSTSQGIRVFQEFFVDIDFPVALTQNDEVEVPIAVFNYLDQPQSVKLRIEKADWFELVGTDAEQTIEIGPKTVSSATLRLRALRPGDRKLTVFAEGSGLADAVERQVRVRPDGKRFETVINGRLSSATSEESIVIPANAIAEGSDLYLKLYPGAFSQVVEGMDSIFRMPNGCFEQTSSTTYPNILVLDYLRRTDQSVPEIEMKALEYINLGYQRLLGFEIQGGGFDWYGKPAANAVLTAYGLQEFVDMNEVYEVDPDLITRTRDWLLGQFDSNGTLPPPGRGIGRVGYGGEETLLQTTAYAASAVANAGGIDSLDATYDYLIENHLTTSDPYTLALCADVFLSMEKKAAAKTVLARLHELRTVSEDEDPIVHWGANEGTGGLMYSRGQSFDIETTALVAQAYQKANFEMETAHQALAWIISQRDPRGTWYSTQATVQAMKALLAGSDSSSTSGTADLRFTANGKEAGTLSITEENESIHHLVSLREYVQDGDNQISIELDDGTKGTNLAYQIVAVHHEPHVEEVDPATEPLSIALEYSDQELSTQDLLDVEVVLRWNRQGDSPMTLVDLGVPPGFTVENAPLEKLVTDGIIEKFTVTGRQITLYFRSIPGSGVATRFNYQLKAKYPVKAKTPPAVAYPYYQPELRTEADPVLLTVTNR